MIKKVGLVLIAVVLIIQFRPVTRENPTATAPLMSSPEVIDVLRESCYDCHSAETVWPWYSYVAPVSWLVVSDVNEGREHLNFSTWQNLPTDEQAEMREEILEEVNEGEMPLDIYLLMHGEARLTEADLAVLQSWGGGAGGFEPEEENGVHADDDQDHR